MIPKNKLEKFKQNETLLEIEWLDVTSKDRMKKTKLEGVNPSDFLVVFKTFGLIHSYDDYSICLIREYEINSDDEEEVDVEFIPICNISNYTELNKKGGK